jgi:hypothetical protein
MWAGIKDQVKNKKMSKNIKLNCGKKIKTGGT